VRNVVLGFGLLTLLLLILFKLAEIKFVRGDARMEIIIAVTSIIFFAIGAYYSRGRSNKNKAPEAPRLFIQENKSEGLTRREMEVLEKMGEGLSNLEIAKSLYLSENTIKTHVSNILFKLDAKRRTEAIRVGREKGLIP
jgi:DNA-binding NarL/FixJ family response regulator